MDNWKREAAFVSNFADERLFVFLGKIVNLQITPLADLMSGQFMLIENINYPLLVTAKAIKTEPFRSPRGSSRN